MNTCVYAGLVCPENYSLASSGDECTPDLFICPENQEINSDRTACVPIVGFFMPFPFLILSFISLVIVLISYYKDRFFAEKRVKAKYFIKKETPLKEDETLNEETETIDLKPI